MQYLYRLSCFVVLFSIIFGGTNVYAQNIFKIDISKTAGKFSGWVQRQVGNFKETMSQISESQFATTIGDGIKAARQGIAYAQEQFNAAIKLYNDTKNAVLNSTEYKIAMLSKEIAEESKKIKEIEEEKEKELSELETTSKIERTSLEEKIKIAQQNFKDGVDILQNELLALQAEGADDVRISELEQEIEIFKIEQEANIAALNSEIENLDTQLKIDSEVITTQFAENIYAQGESIADLTLQMEELMEQDKKENDKKNQDPEQAFDKTVKDFSFEKDEFVTLEMKEKKEESTLSKQKDSFLDSMNTTTSIAKDTENTKEKLEREAGVSSTVNGKSEVLAEAIKQTSSQLEILYTYMVSELAAIEAKTATLIAINKTYRPDAESKAQIDICNYEEKEEPGDMVDSVNKIKIESNLQNVKQNVEDIKETENGITTIEGIF